MGIGPTPPRQSFLYSPVGERRARALLVTEAESLKRPYLARIATLDTQLQTAEEVSPQWSLLFKTAFFRGVCMFVCVHAYVVCLPLYLSLSVCASFLQLCRRRGCFWSILV